MVQKPALRKRTNVNLSGLNLSQSGVGYLKERDKEILVIFHRYNIIFT